MSIVKGGFKKVAKNFPNLKKFLVSDNLPSWRGKTHTVGDTSTSFSEVNYVKMIMNGLNKYKGENNGFE